MTNYNKRINDTSARIGEVRFSYLHALEPAANNFGGDPMYSTAVLWPKEDKATTKMVEDCIQAAKEKDAGKCWAGKIPAGLRTPVRDGDEDRPDDPNYAGMYWMNVKSKNKPGVRQLLDGHVTDVFPEDIYSGMYGAITLSFYGYNTAGNKGVGVSMQNLIKTREGDRLSGGQTADAAFADMGDGEDDCLR